MVRNGLTPLV